MGGLFTCSVTHFLTSFIPSFPHSFIHSFTRRLAHAYWAPSVSRGCRCGGVSGTTPAVEQLTSWGGHGPKQRSPGSVTRGPGRRLWNQEEGGGHRGRDWGCARVGPRRAHGVTRAGAVLGGQGPRRAVLAQLVLHCLPAGVSQTVGHVRGPHNVLRGIPSY